MVDDELLFGREERFFRSVLQQSVGAGKRTEEKTVLCRNEQRTVAGCID